jgi:hypothetical protein
MVAINSAKRYLASRNQSSLVPYSVRVVLGSQQLYFPVVRDHDGMGWRRRENLHLAVLAEAKAQLGSSRRLIFSSPSSLPLQGDAAVQTPTPTTLQGEPAPPPKKRFFFYRNPFQWRCITSRIPGPQVLPMQAAALVKTWRLVSGALYLRASSKQRAGGTLRIAYCTCWAIELFLIAREEVSSYLHVLWMNSPTRSCSSSWSSSRYT